jgi:hypothetical protein
VVKACTIPCLSLKFPRFKQREDMAEIMRIPLDVRWCIVRRLSVADIVHLRLLSRGWYIFVDAISQEEWKHLYMMQVCDMLIVSASFDWKRAAIVTSKQVNSVEAVCTWNKERVRIAAPWCTNGINPLLRSDVKCVSSSPAVVDYVYGGMFLLRGCLRTCRYRYRPNTKPCRNCQSKQICLLAKYDYFVRHVSEDTSARVRDECFGLLLSPLFSSLTAASGDP